MSAPKRIQRKRTKGWQMPEGAVYVGRPSKWGNPFRVGDYVGPVYDCEQIRNAAQAVFVFTGRRHHFGISYPSDEEVRAALAGRDLVCWCPLDQPCHADVLLAIANGTSAKSTDDRDALAEVLYPSHKASECSRAACHQCAQTYRTVDAILGSDWLYRYADRVAAAARADERRKVEHECEQVGWYCNHLDQPSGKSSHVDDPQTRGSLYRMRVLEHLDWTHPEKPPPCPRAVPVYTHRTKGQP